MTWTQRYRQAHHDYTKAKSPAFFAASGGDSMKVSYPKVTGTNGLTRAVINMLLWSGHHCERINNMGRPVDKRKSYIDIVGRTRVTGSIEWQKGTGTKGTADIHADIVHINHRFPIPVKIEIKWNKDRMSNNQEDYQAVIEAKGGVYVVVKTIEGFILWYDSFIQTL